MTDIMQASVGKPPNRRRARERPITARPRSTIVDVAHPRLPGAVEKVERPFDTIEHMRRSKQLDGRQWQAAAMYRSAWDVLFGSIGGALDFSRARGGGIPGAPPAPHYLAAASRISEAKRILYARDERLVRLIIGDGRTLEESTRLLMRAEPTQLDKRKAGDRLREALDVLADKWLGVAHGKLRKWRAPDAVQPAGEVSEIKPGRVAHVTRAGVKMSGEDK